MSKLGTHHLLLGDLRGIARDESQAIELRRTSLPVPEAGPWQPLEPWRDDVRAAASLQAAWRNLPARRTLLFPVSSSVSASLLPVRMAKVLSRLSQAPLLLIDLYTEGDREYQLREELQDHSGAVFSQPSSQLSPDEVPAEKPAVVVMAMAQESDPLELLASDRFSSFLRRFSEAYGSVLINGPSPRQSAASLLAARHCNGAICMIEEGVSRINEIQQAGAAMEQAHCDVLGFFYMRTSKQR